MNKSKHLYPPDPVVLVDDEAEFLMSAELTLISSGINSIKTFQDSRKVEQFIENNPVSAVALDINMPNISGRTLLPGIVEKYPEIPVIMITAVNEVDAAVESMKNGAFDYLVKPVDDARLASTFKRALEMRRVLDENTRLKEYLLYDKLQHPEAFTTTITTNKAMRSIFKYLEAISSTHLPVLITGETGTGKELIARAIHTLSGRTGEFVAENVAGLDDTLFSDTLFGHKKGAFTSADQERRGLIEKAAGGTFFLDEIGDLSIESQVKLLRLLQEKQYYPLGSDVAKMTDARIVVATLRNLDSMVAAETFRQDLYYRLQAHHITLPPLRDRKDDIPLLVNHFLKKAAEELGKTPPTPPRELYTLLKTYQFPGNIRELEGMVFDAVSRHKSGVLSTETFREKISPRTTAKSEPATENGTAPAHGDIRFGDILPTLKETEGLLVQEALQRSDGNQSIAAHMLGMTRRALNNRLQRNKNT